MVGDGGIAFPDRLHRRFLVRRRDRAVPPFERLDDDAVPRLQRDRGPTGREPSRRSAGTWSRVNARSSRSRPGFGRCGTITTSPIAHPPATVPPRTDPPRDLASGAPEPSGSPGDGSSHLLT